MRLFLSKSCLARISAPPRTGMIIDLKALQEALIHLPTEPFHPAIKCS